MAKECHPDYLGDEGHNICILLNEAYEVSMQLACTAFCSLQLQQVLQYSRYYSCAANSSVQVI